MFYLQTGRPVFEKYLYLGHHLADPVREPFHSSPVYTVWMYLASYRAGLPHDGLRAIQLFAGILTVYLITDIARMAFGRREALATGWLYGLCSSVILFESDLVTASFVNLVHAATAWCVIRSSTRSDSPAAWWLLIGLLLGISIGIRPNVILAVPLIIPLIPRWRSRFRQAAWRAGLFLAGTVIAVAPVTLTNFFRTGERILVTASQGAVFYSSNNYRATGLGYSPPPALTSLENQTMKHNRTDRPVEHAVFHFLAERAAGRPLTHKESSDFYMQAGWRYLAADPVGSLLFGGRKLVYLFNDYDVLDTASLIDASRRIRSVMPFLLPPGVILVFGCVGWFYSLPWRRSCWILVLLAIPHVITGMMFYVNGRLRVPLLVCLAVPAGAAVVRLMQFIRVRDASVWMMIVGLMGCATVVTWQPLAIRRHARVETPGFYNTVLGMAAMSKGDRTGAMPLFQRAVSANPLGAVEAWEYLAMLYTDAGQSDMARKAMDRANGFWSMDALDRLSEIEEMAPDELLLARGRTLWATGDRREAMQVFREAVQRYPHHPDALFNYAMMLAGTGDQWDRVAETVRRALDAGMNLSMESSRAHDLLIRAYEALGWSEQREAVRIQKEWESRCIFSPE
ncbi:tetratricopeptide repeat protein [bacterium]|nr:tetratricopeptide repeat protein [candidate division CSSED10-310 bacterium]